MEKKIPTQDEFNRLVKYKSMSGYNKDEMADLWNLGRLYVNANFAPCGGCNGNNGSEIKGEIYAWFNLNKPIFEAYYAKLADF